VILGFELMLTRQVLYHLSHSISPVFVFCIFGIVSCELFAQAGFDYDPPDLYLPK
jgi:hypothetical protein